MNKSSKGIRIPAFLSKVFNSLESKDEKDVFIDGYKHWRKSEYTEALIEFIESSLNSKIRDEEERKDFISLFQSKYYSAHNKGYRLALRDFQKQIK